MIGAESLINLFKMEDKAWSFGLDKCSISDVIKQYKLTLIEDVGNSYYQENYLKPIGRNLDVSKIERIVYARIWLLKKHPIIQNWISGCFLRYF